MYDHLIAQAIVLKPRKITNVIWGYCGQFKFGAPDTPDKPPQN
jgi:hypothetical protein